MSQRAEKYARRMECRVDKLEKQADAIWNEQAHQGAKISVLEDDLAVYRAAASVREYKQAAANMEAARKARAAKRERERHHREIMARIVFFTLLATLAAIIVARAHTEEAAADPVTTPAVTIAAADWLTTIPAEEWPEDPLEAEKIEEALLEQGYFSLAVPLPFEYQDYMRTYCAAYGCPYPLALAVAERETGGKFNMDAVGANGEVGIMQLNPGPDGAYHAELQAATGLDPTTPAGNIAGGCYLLGKYMEAYGDVEKAAMAYNMGVTGARQAWEAGITSTDYSAAVMECVEKWECTVNAWNGV